MARGKFTVVSSHARTESLLVLLQTGFRNQAGGPNASTKVEPANDRPSPRSVLVHTSPPDTPPALPISFSYPELGTPAPRASEGAPASVTVPAAGSQPDVPPRRRRLERAPRFRQAAGVTVRGGDPKPRRLFDPSSRSTTLMIRNIPNDFRCEPLFFSLVLVAALICSVDPRVSNRFHAGGRG